MGKFIQKKCKSCYKEDVRANRERNKEYYRNYDKLRSNNPDRVEARNLYQQGKGKDICSKAKKNYMERNKRRGLCIQEQAMLSAF